MSHNMDEEQKAIVTRLAHELVYKIIILQRRLNHEDGFKPIDFADFAEELKEECNALARLISNYSD